MKSLSEWFFFLRFRKKTNGYTIVQLALTVSFFYETVKGKDYFVDIFHLL